MADVIEQAPGEPPEYRSCRCGPDGQEHWHTIVPTPWDTAAE